MRSIEDVRANLASYKSLMKRQGDFTIYASKYIQDIELVMGLLSAEKPTKKKKPDLPGVTPRKTTKASESKD
jgi:hypothetical protein